MRKNTHSNHLLTFLFIVDSGMLTFTQNKTSENNIVKKTKKI